MLWRSTSRQWDMTLYLGINLKDEREVPLYTESRVAALTQLPWLREGAMPAWLRRRARDPT